MVEREGYCSGDRLTYHLAKLAEFGTKAKEATKFLPELPEKNVMVDVELINRHFYAENSPAIYALASLTLLLNSSINALIIWARAVEDKLREAKQ